MADYTLPEAEEQIVRAGGYFGRVLTEHKRAFLAARANGVTIVVATGDAGKRLEEQLVGDGILGAARIDRPAGEPVEAGRPVVLIPRMHEGSGAYAGKAGHIHLHVLSDVRIGRRERLSGECLCGKRRGSNERTPREGETEICGECREVADAHALAWSL